MVVRVGNMLWVFLSSVERWRVSYRGTTHGGGITADETIDLLNRNALHRADSTSAA
jgi:hypothetical protein